MALYEVAVRTVSEVYYLVEAKDADTARKNWTDGTDGGEFVESEDVVSVRPYDDRFDDLELGESV